MGIRFVHRLLHSASSPSAPCVLSFCCRAVVFTFAGGNPGWIDAAGAASAFNFPTGVAVDASGIVLVADRNNNRVRRVTPSRGTRPPDGNWRGAHFVLCRSLFFRSNLIGHGFWLIIWFSTSMSVFSVAFVFVASLVVLFLFWHL